jgi:hypothetical protein
MFLILAFSCSMAGKWQPDTAGEPDPEEVDADTDADTDSDTDADSDTDTDSDTDADTDSDTDADSARAPSAGDLVISEIMKNPDMVDDDLGEWFEVTNVSRDALLLEGIEVLDNDGDGFVVSAWTLGGGGRVVFGASADTASNGGAPVDVAYDVELFKLGNDDGSITLILGGDTLDAVAYDGSFPDEKGHSLTLSADRLDSAANDDATAWCDGAAAYGAGDFGTPGGANEVCETGGDTDTGPVDSDGDGTLDEDDCDPDDEDVFPGAAESENGVDDDCDGYVDERAPTLGDLVITEIMKNPDPTSDDYGEWFELVNAAGDALALDGLEVVDAGGTGFTLTTEAVLEPAEVYLLAPSDDTTQNGGITPDYVYDIDDLRLSNSDDEIVLLAGGVLIDEVAYDNDFPDDSGKSLSLDPTGFSSSRNDDPDYWCEGDGEYGTDGNQGTPGEINDTCP